MLSASKCLLTLAAALVLSSCATATVPHPPPAELYAPCAEPVLGGRTNGDVGNYVLALKDALRGCAASVDAWTEWAKGTFPGSKSVQ